MFTALDSKKKYNEKGQLLSMKMTVQVHACCQTSIHVCQFAWFVHILGINLGKSAPLDWQTTKQNVCVAVMSLFRSAFPGLRSALWELHRQKTWDTGQNISGVKRACVCACVRAHLCARACACVSGSELACVCVVPFLFPPLSISLFLLSLSL